MVPLVDAVEWFILHVSTAHQQMEKVLQVLGVARKPAFATIEVEDVVSPAQSTLRLLDQVIAVA